MPYTQCAITDGGDAVTSDPPQSRMCSGGSCALRARRRRSTSNGTLVRLSGEARPKPGTAKNSESKLVGMSRYMHEKRMLRELLLSSFFLAFSARRMTNSNGPECLASRHTDAGLDGNADACAKRRRAPLVSFSTHSSISDLQSSD